MLCAVRDTGGTWPMNVVPSSSPEGNGSESIPSIGGQWYAECISNSSRDCGASSRRINLPRNTTT